MPEKSYKPTEAMRAAAKRGLALREKWGRGGLSSSQANSEGVGSGVARARDIINGSLSYSTVKRMNSFFARHEKNYAPSKKESDGGPTAGTIAYLLWGGPGGKSWAAGIVAREEKKQQKSILKAKNEKLKQATFVCMVPDLVDAHGDVTDIEEVRKACFNFNTSDAEENLFHMFKTSSYTVVESYVLPVEIEMEDAAGELRSLPKGTWLMTLQFHSDEVWKGVESGEFNGISIGAMGRVEELEPEGN